MRVKDFEDAKAMRAIARFVQAVRPKSEVSAPRNQKNLALRRASARANRAIAEIAGFVKEDDMTLARSALVALAELNGHVVTGLLQAAQRASDSQGRLRAYQALGWLGREFHREILISLLELIVQHPDDDQEAIREALAPIFEEHRQQREREAAASTANAGMNLSLDTSNPRSSRRKTVAAHADPAATGM
jgi:hypothetical protein